MTEPTYRIARGNPTDEETAAVIAVLAGMVGAGQPRRDAPELTYAGGWSSRWRAMRPHLHVNQISWRGTYR